MTILKKTPSYEKILILVYVLLLIVLLTPRIIGNDGIGYYVYLRSLFFDHDLDFTNEFAHYGSQYVIVGHSPVTGRPVVGVPIGSAVLWAPFYIAAHYINLIFLIAPADGYSAPYVVAVCFASSLYGFIGLFLIYKMAIRFFSKESVFAAILIFWLSSPLVFYMYLHPSMSHANSLFAVSLFLFLWCRIYLDGKNFLKDWMFLGLSAGLMTMVRLQDILFLFVPILCLLVGATGRSPLRDFKRILIFIIFFIIAFLPEMFAWKAIFGSYFSGPQSEEVGAHMNFLYPHIIGVFFSGRHGLITWNPIILVGLIGLMYFYRKEKYLTLSLIIIFLVQLWIIGSWRTWWGAHSFGHRMFLSSSPLFIFGLAGLFEYLFAQNYRKIIYAVGIVLILWNFGLIFQYVTNLLDRDGLTPFTQVIINQFTEVPQKLCTQLGHLFSTRLKI
jgi:hypothetical protein